MATRVGKAKIRMRPVPKRPVRGTEKHKWYLEEGETLAGVVRYFIDIGFDPRDVKCVYKYGGYDESDEYFFVAEGPESDESFQAKMNTYENKMRAYRSWYEENEVLIREELERRRILAEEKKVKDEEKAKKRLQKARERAARELAKLDKKITQMIGK